MDMRQKIQFCGHVRQKFGFPESVWPMDVFHELRALYKLKSRHLMSYTYLKLLLEDRNTEVPEYAIKVINDCGIYVNPQDRGSCYVSNLTCQMHAKAQSLWSGGFNGLVERAKDLF